MVETAKMNSQLSTSYSTPYTLWGLSRRYLALLRRDLTTAPIINIAEVGRLWRRSAVVIRNASRFLLYSSQLQ